MVVQRTCGKVDPVEDPTEFIRHLEGDERYTSLVSEDAGQCAPAARTIGELLAHRGYVVSYRGIALLALPRLPRGQNGPRDEALNLVANNLNHFAVVVTIAGTAIVVDPTQGQFVQGKSQLAVDTEWKEQMLRVRVKNAGREEGCRRQIVYSDFKTFEEANQLFGGEPMRVKPYEDFKGTGLRTAPIEDKWA